MSAKRTVIADVNCHCCAKTQNIVSGLSVCDFRALKKWYENIFVFL